MSLGGTVPKHLNTSRIPAQGMQNTSQKNSANVTFTSGKCPPWRHSSETLEHQQDSSPRHAKHKPEKPLRTLPLESIKQQFYRPWDSSPASKTIGKCPLDAQFRNTWTPAGFQPKACKTQARKTLRTLPLPVANVPWRHSSETLEHQQDSGPRHAKHKPEKLSERYLWNHKKQQFYHPWDASPASKTIGKCPLDAQFRNTWTPAGFQPKACKTQARKTLRTLPLESIKNNYSIAREMPLQLAKPLANVPWRHSSETLERQQDSSPRHAKHKPEKLCERYLYQWQMSLGGTVPKHSNTSRIRAQGMQNTSQKNSPNVTFGIHKNNNSIAREMANAPWRHNSETLERQQDSSPRHAKHKPEKLCGPKACKAQARKTLRTLPLPVANVPWRHSSETLEHQQDSSPRHAKHKPEKLSERYL